MMKTYRHEFKPIQVTKWGDKLAPYPSAPDTWVSEVQTNPTIGEGSAFIHHTCNGFIDARSVSDSHRVFNCRNCNLRFGVPLYVDSIVRLSRYMVWTLGKAAFALHSCTEHYVCDDKFHGRPSHGEPLE